MLWNLETGAVVLGVWIMFQGYEILYFNSLKEKKTYIEIAKVFLGVILTVILYFGILNLITFLRTRRNSRNKKYNFRTVCFLGLRIFHAKNNILADHGYCLL